MNPPAVIVHGVEQAHTALALGLPVTLLSAPWAGVYAGCGWWRAVVAQAAEAAGMAAPPADILDCGDAPGRALEALRVGQRVVVLRATAALVANIAGRGLVVLAGPPVALDLGVPGAARGLGAWLRGT